RQKPDSQKPDPGSRSTTGFWRDCEAQKGIGSGLLPPYPNSVDPPPGSAHPLAESNSGSSSRQQTPLARGRRLPPAPGQPARPGRGQSGPPASQADWWSGAQPPAAYPKSFAPAKTR